MSESRSADSVAKSVTVACDPATAFRLWSERIDAWWPEGHAPSGVPGSVVRMETGVGGRIYERTPAGREHDMARITLWSPPERMELEWYLGSGPSRPSRVAIHFIDRGGRTEVRVVHNGPQFIGELWYSRKETFSASWETVLAGYAATVN